MDFSSYELPGVYVNEVEGPSLASGGGGNAVLALVGMAHNSRSASVQSTLPMTLANNGIEQQSISVTNRVTGMKLVQDVDYELSGPDDNGYMRVKQHEATDSADLTTVTINQTDGIVVGTAQLPLDSGYILEGSVTLNAVGDEYTELVIYEEGMGDGDWDYAVDNGTGEIVWNTVTEDDGTDTVTKTRKSLIPVDTPIGTDQTHGSGYKVTEMQPVVLLIASPVLLRNGYAVVDPSTEPPIIPELYTTDGSSVTLASATFGTDFDIDDTRNTIVNLGGLSTSTTYYVRYTHTSVADNAVCMASYNYLPADYYTPTYVTSWREVKEMFGAGWNTDGSVSSELSRAAYVAFQNGAPGMYLVPVQPTGGETATALDWADAFERMDAIENVDIIVPVSGDSAVHELANSYINSRLINEMESRIIVGYDGTANIVPSASLIQSAQRFASERVAVVSPSTIVMTNPITSINEVVPGYLLAVAVGAYSSSVPQYTPLTNKLIYGFYDNNETRTKTEQKNEIANGVMYIGTDQIKIVHGVTTDTSSIIRREYSVSIVKDMLFRRLRNLYGDVIGQPLTARTTANVQANTLSFLANLLNAGYINDFHSISVLQDTSELTKLNVSFSYLPVFGVNYIEVTFTIDTTTTV